MAVLLSPTASWTRMMSPNVAGLPTTIMGWSRKLPVANEFSSLFYYGNHSGSNYLGVWHDLTAGSGDDLLFVTPSLESASPIGTDWFFWAVRYATGANNIILYRRFENQDTFTVNTGTWSETFTTIRVSIGGFANTSDYTHPGAFAHVRIFDGSLTEEQIMAESMSATPIQSMTAAWPFASTADDTTDISGNNQTLDRVGTGSYTTVDDPILVPPASPAEGSAFFALGIDLSALGRSEHVGTASLDFNFDIVGTGAPEHSGDSDLGLTFVVTGVGSAADVSEGTSAFDLEFGLDAAGRSELQGSTGFNLGISVDGTGVSEPKGSADTGITIGFDGVGRSELQGSSDLDLNFNVTGSGEVDHLGSSDVGITFNIEGTGTANPVNTAEFNLVFDILCEGKSPREGSSSFDLDIGFDASGKSEPKGSAGLALGFEFEADGLSESKAVSDFALLFDIEAVGHSGPVPNEAAVSLLFGVEAVGQSVRPARGQSALDLNFNVLGIGSGQDQNQSGVTLWFAIEAEGRSSAMPHPHDWITLNEAKRALDIALPDTSQNNVLQNAIAALSNRLDHGAGPAVKRRVVEVYDGGFNNGYSRSAIVLASAPVAEFHSVIEYQNGSPVELDELVPGGTPDNGYSSEQFRPQMELFDGLLVRIVSGHPASWWAGKKNVVVDYTAGRWDSTSEVEARYKEACVVSLKNWWRMYQMNIGNVGEFDTPAESFPTYAVPNAARQILHDVWKSEVGFGA